MKNLKNVKVEMVSPSKVLAELGTDWVKEVLNLGVSFHAVYDGQTPIIETSKIAGLETGKLAAFLGRVYNTAKKKEFSETPKTAENYKTLKSTKVLVSVLQDAAFHPHVNRIFKDFEETKSKK